MRRMSRRQNRDNKPEDGSVGLKSVVAMMTCVMEEAGIIEFEGSATKDSPFYTDMVSSKAHGSFCPSSGHTSFLSPPPRLCHSLSCLIHGFLFVCCFLDDVLYIFPWLNKQQMLAS